MLLKRREHMLHFRLTVLGNGWRLGMFRDVTDLEGARQLAVEARQTLILAMEAMDDGIAFLDRDERLVQCNEAYRRFMQGLPEIVTPGVALTGAVHHAGKVVSPPERGAGGVGRAPALDPALGPTGADPVWAEEMGARVAGLRLRRPRRGAGERRLRGAPPPARPRTGAGRRREVARGRGGGRPGQVDLPRHHEPRDPNADERRFGHDGGAGGRGRARGPGAHRGDHARIGPGVAAHHRRRARLLQDRGGRARSSRRCRSR